MIVTLAIACVVLTVLVILLAMYTWPRRRLCSPSKVVHESLSLTVASRRGRPKGILCCRLRWNPRHTPPFIRIYRNDLVYENTVHVARYQNQSTNLFQLEYNWCQGTVVGNKTFPYNNSGLGRDQYGVYFIKGYTDSPSGMIDITSYNLARIHYISWSKRDRSEYRVVCALLDTRNACPQSLCSATTEYVWI